ncbi:MAG TPA: metallophosphoesterase [Pseudomonadales bacterium]|nr:metallophosphoesterase [Pseudomonadales bacterium]
MAAPSLAPAARIGLIGDVHAEPEYLATALRWFEGRGLDALLCTGDVADGQGCVNRCCELLMAYEVQCVAGNHERWILADRMRQVPHAHALEALDDGARAFLDGLPRTRRLATVRGPLLLCHGVGERDHGKVWPGSARMAAERAPELDALIAEDEVRFMVNGHLHYRMILDFEALTLINAGTLKRDHRPGFVELDLDAGAVRFLGFDARGEVHEQDCFALDDHDRRVFRDTQAFDGDWQPFPRYG